MALLVQKFERVNILCPLRIGLAPPCPTYTNTLLIRIPLLLSADSAVLQYIYSQCTVVPDAYWAKTNL